MEPFRHNHHEAHGRFSIQTCQESARSRPATELKAASLSIDGSSILKILEIRDKGRWLQSKELISPVIIDYLRL
jgi:replicative DNA helicase